MSAQLRAEKAIEELKNKNPYYEKYSSKISTLQQSSPEEFLNRLDKVPKEAAPPKPEAKPRYTLAIITKLCIDFVKIIIHVLKRLL